MEEPAYLTMRPSFCKDDEIEGPTDILENSQTHRSEQGDETLAAGRDEDEMVVEVDWQEYSMRVKSSR